MTSKYHWCESEHNITGSDPVAGYNAWCVGLGLQAAVRCTDTCARMCMCGISAPISY